MSVAAKPFPGTGSLPIDPSALDRFRADLARLCGPEPGDLLVAVSGGADSLALLVLARSALGRGVRAATVDHGLRPEAAAEAVFVGDVCRELGVPHATLRGTLPARVGGSGNLSARARLLRYDLLDRHRAGIGCTWLATAHHAEDQLETLLMRLNRGSGLAGLSGIRARAALVVRPLLGWRREELAALVATAGLAPVVDPTNADVRFDRARLRRAIAGADWLDPVRWTRSAAALGQAEEALSWSARRLAAERIASDGGLVTLKLGVEPVELLRRLVTDCLVRVVPGAHPRGGEAADLANRLRASMLSRTPFAATLAGVAVSTRHAEGSVAIFVPAAPHGSSGSG